MGRDAGVPRAAARWSAAALMLAVLAGCGADEAASPLPGGGGPVAASTGPTATASGSTGAARPGETQLSSGSVLLTVRPEAAGQRPVLEAYLGFFAAYAEALGKADAQSAELRRRSTPEAFADFSRGIAANAREGVTLRGPVTLRPAVRKRTAGALTVIVDDCLDGTGQRFYDRSGEATGQAGDRRSIRVELVDSPGPVRWIVGSVADGPATACERSGS